jgi:hypothetical protein
LQALEKRAGKKVKAKSQLGHIPEGTAICYSPGNLVIFDFSSQNFYSYEHTSRSSFRRSFTLPTASMTFEIILTQMCLRLLCHVGSTLAEIQSFDTQSVELSKRGLGRGILWYLSTQGGHSPYMHPLPQNLIKLTSSGWLGSLEPLVGNQPCVSVSRGIEGSWFGIELAMYVMPSAYSLRHGWTSADGALHCWDLLGSPDGKEWHVLRQHHKDVSLATGGFSSHTWEIAQSDVPIPCRFFRVQLTGTHIGTQNYRTSGLLSENPAVVRRRRRATSDAGGGRHFIYCCGFEVYGQVVHPPPGFLEVDAQAWSDGWR